MFSDKRLKTDFQYIDDPLRKIDRIQGVYYSWKDKLVERHVGRYVDDIDDFTVSNITLKNDLTKDGHSSVHVGIENDSDCYSYKDNHLNASIDEVKSYVDKDLDMKSTMNQHHDNARRLRGVYLKWNDTEIDQQTDDYVNLQSVDKSLKDGKKDKNASKHSGFIAQELQSVFPEVVLSQIDGEFDRYVDSDEKDIKENTRKPDNHKNDQYLGVNYDGIIALLIEGINELNNDIDRYLDTNVHVTVDTNLSSDASDDTFNSPESFQELTHEDTVNMTNDEVMFHINQYIHEIQRYQVDLLDRMESFERTGQLI